MHRTLTFASSCALALLAAAPAASPDHKAPPATKLLVKAARIYTACADGSIISFTPGAMLVDRGKVVAIGKELEAPIDAKVVDLGSQVVMPGLVAATSSLVGDSGNVDTNSAHIRAADAFNAIADYRRVLLGGATTVYLSPGTSRLISGQGAVVKLRGKDVASSILVDSVQLEINLGQSSLQPPPKTVFPIPPSADNPIQPSLVQLPTTRLGQLMGIREAFEAGRKPPRDADVQVVALARAIERRMTMRIHADASADLLRAVEIAKELGLPAMISGAAEGAEVIDALAQAQLPVIVEVALSLSSPPADLPYQKDSMKLRPETAAKLVEKGIKVAISAPFGASLEDLMVSGAVAMRGGLGRTQTIAAMTRIPAELLGVADHVGSLAPGKDADFLVLSDEPFARDCHVLKVYVDGQLAASREALDKMDAAPAVVIRAGTILTSQSEPILGGAVVIRAGKIAGIGREVAMPPNAQVIDAGPMAVITPGFIDANSHLDFDGDRASFGLENDLTRIVAQSGDDAKLVARGGVTTVMLQPWTVNANGSRVVALKTTGESRAARVIKAVAAIRIAWPDEFDPVDTEARFDGMLKSGQEYQQKWKKYQEDLAKWEQEQAKGTPVAAAAPPAAEEKSEASGTEKRADPLTGKWEVSISGGPMPEPQKGVMNLKLEGEKVTGSFAAMFGDEENPAQISGTFSGGHLVATLEVETQIGKPKIDAQVADDKMNGTLGLGERFKFDLDGVRTEKTYTEVTVISKSKKKAAGGKPDAPDVNPSLEPYRALFDGKIPLLLDVSSPIVVRRALALFVDKYKVSLVLIGGRGLLQLDKDSLRKVKGVIAPVQAFARWGDDVVVPASEFSTAGVPLAFQSDGATASQGLAINAAYLVRQGMDPGAALRALTSDAARIFQVDDRVGSLAVGKDGDVLVFSGDPFDLSSRLLHVFVGGEEVPMEDSP